MVTAPVANDIELTYDEQTPSLQILFEDILANDSFSGSGTRTITSVRGDIYFENPNIYYPNPELVAGIANPQDTYIEFQWIEGQAGDYYGTFDLLYTVSENGLEDEGIVRITINNVNDVPFGVEDGYKVEQGTTLVLEDDRGLLRNDNVDPRNVDGDTLSAVLDSGPSNGTLNLNPDGSFDYTPNAGFSGTDSFTYYVNDGTVNSDLPVTVSIDVVAADPTADAPVANDDVYSGEEDPAGGYITIKSADVLSNDVYNGGPNPIQLDAVYGAIGGRVSLEDANIFFYPDPHFNGEASFIYVLSDERLQDYGKVTINIDAVNDAPIANADGSGNGRLDTYMAYTGETMDVVATEGVLFNDFDFDGDTLTAKLESDVSHGTLNLNADGSFTYTSDAGYSGLDTFQYFVSDGSLESNAVTVNITVNDAGTEGGNGTSLPPLADTSGGGWNDGGPSSGNDTFEGGSSDETAFGRAGDDVINGGAGNDVLGGQAGSDTVNGDAGADTIGGGDGDDVLDGGWGNDVVYGRGMNDDISGGSDEDALWGNLGDDTLSGDGGSDTLRGGFGSDEMDGGNGKDYAYGEAGNDTIRGGAQDDVLEGGNGDDVLFGNQNGDILRGDGGADKVFGQLGADKIFGGALGDTLGGGFGDDFIDGEAGADLIAGGGGDDLAYGGVGNDTLFGGDGDDLLFGQGGSDRMFGGSGRDEVTGGNGADTLFGGDGMDTLSGGDGNDKLNGAAGDDVLTGGAGADSFVFRALGEEDTITDFAVTEDLLLLGEGIWGGGMTEQEVVDTYATESGGNTSFDFGGGLILTLEGVATADDLVSQIDFV